MTTTLPPVINDHNNGMGKRVGGRDAAKFLMMTPLYNLPEKENLEEIIEVILDATSHIPATMSDTCMSCDVNLPSSFPSSPYMRFTQKHKTKQ